MTTRTDYSQFEQRVLILLCGTSPAVVTETLYVLAQPQDPDQQRLFVPTIIKIITTTQGRQILFDEVMRCSFTLRDGSRGNRMQCLAQDLGLKSFSLTLNDILVPKLEGGEEIDDAHNKDQLDAMGDLVLSTLRQYTYNSETAVFLSLSGGRKSMGHIAGQCMTAQAREWDKLIHVIVKPTWLEKVEFYYPNDGTKPQAPADHELKEGELANLDQEKNPAVLEFSEEPFFRLAPEIYEKSRLGQPDSFAQLVTHFGGRTGDLVLTLDESNMTANINGVQVKFGGAIESSICYAYLIRLARQGELQYPPTDREMLDILIVRETLLQNSGQDTDSTQRHATVKQYFTMHSGIFESTPKKLYSLEFSAVQANFDASDSTSQKASDDRKRQNSLIRTAINAGLLRAAPKTRPRASVEIPRLKSGKAVTLPKTLKIKLIGEST